LLSAVLERSRPLVVDADALNLLALEPLSREDWILTPHPGEAARLLGCSTASVQSDRFRAAAEITHRYGGVCVLKGAGTVIADGRGRVAVCSAGNPGMASGGMGDVLTGVISGLLAQRLPLFDAARVGVCLHAAAADLAASDGERGMLASDLLPWIRTLANPSRPAR
jgi:NAD(P)H-hydrate epimerase